MKNESQLPLEFGVGSWISRDGYQFDPESDRWRLSRDIVIPLEWIEEGLLEPLRSGFRWALARNARDYAAESTSNMASDFKKLVIHISSRSSPSVLTAAMVLSYRSTLDRSTEYLLGSLKSFFKRWSEWGEQGIGEDALKALSEMRLRGNIKGEAVALRDPKKGPLTELEFTALYQKLVDGYESGEVSLSNYVLVLLFIATGARTTQIGDLKCSDLKEVQSSDGVSVFILNVPRRKQRGRGFRTDFKPVALTIENGSAIKAQIQYVAEHWIAVGGDEELVDCLPLFPKWKEIHSYFKRSKAEQALEVLSDRFHLGRQVLGNRANKTVERLEVPSERTEILRIMPTRLRRTLATRMAREGYGPVPIAEALGHTDTQNAKVYTENVPEHVDAINEAVAFQLAPLAQAFSGMLVDKESDATRGDDLASRVRTDDGKGAGTCGHYGFCGALAPIACYTCKAFQPWLDGPHKEVFDLLQSQREGVVKKTKDEVIASTNDRTMIAVAEVIKLCERRRKEVKENE